MFGSTVELSVHRQSQFPTLRRGKAQIRVPSFAKGTRRRGHLDCAVNPGILTVSSPPKVTVLLSDRTPDHFWQKAPVEISSGRPICQSNRPLQLGRSVGRKSQKGLRQSNRQSQSSRSQSAMQKPIPKRSCGETAVSSRMASIRHTIRCS
jgi:hypothetical protein